MENLEKIDVIRQRMSVGYREAKEALDLNNGDIVGALVYLEAQVKAKEQQAKHGIMGQLRTIVDKGSHTHIHVKKGEKTVFKFPASIGALGLAGALASTQVAVVGVLGAATLMAKKYTLEMDKHTENIEDDDEEDYGGAPENPQPQNEF